MIVNRRVKFIWGGSRVRPGRWYLGLVGFYTRNPGHPDDSMAVSVRGVLGWALALGCAAYLAGVSALYWFWHRNPYSLLSYTDALLLPVRRQIIAEKNGRALINQGVEYYRARNWPQAFHYLRLGLDRNPRDARARLLLAQFHAAANQHVLAWHLLEEGLAEEYPGRPYLEMLFTFAEKAEDYSHLVRLCDRCLPLAAGESLARDRLWIRGRKFTALVAARRLDEAVQYARNEAPGPIAWEHRAVALAELGRAEEAAALLEIWRAQAPSDTAAIARLEARVYREAKRFDEMDRALAEVKRQAPGMPEPLVYDVVQKALAGQTERAREALDDYLFRFAAALDGIVLIAEPLAEVGERELIERCIVAAREHGFRPERLEVLYADVLLQRGDWSVARRVLAENAKSPTADTPEARQWREWVERLLDAAEVPTEAAQRALVELLRARPHWPAVYHRTVQSLIRAARWETARDAVEVALRALPGSELLRMRRDEVERALAARSVAPNAVVAAPPVWTEKRFLAALETAGRERRWTEVEQLLRELKYLQPRPPWAFDRRDVLQLAQLRLDHARGDRDALLGTARVFLDENETRAGQLMDVVRREFSAAADRESALALAKLVLRSFPQHAAARQTVAELSPPPPGKSK